MNRNSKLLIISNFVSQFGSTFSYMGIALYAYERSKSNFAVGFVILLVMVSHFITGPFIIKYADRWNKKQTLILCDLFSFVLVLFWSFFSSNMILGYTIVFLNGILANIHKPIQQALISVVSEKKSLDKMNTIFGMSGQINILLGFSGGAIILQYLGINMLLKLDSVTFFVSALLISFMCFGKDKKINNAVVESGVQSLRSLIVEFKKSETLTLIFVPLIILQIAFGANNALPIGFARSCLGVDIAKAGILEALAGPGFLIGGLLITFFKKWRDEHVFFVAGLCLVSSGIVLGLSNSYAFASIVWFLAGFVNVFTFVKWRSFVQKNVVEQFQSRAFSFIMTVISIVQLASIIASSLLADIYNPSSILIIFGAFSLSLLIIYYSWLFFCRTGETRLQKIKRAT